jgi:peptidoglycan/LPS O-acetylase OafA/YrhL
VAATSTQRRTSISYLPALDGIRGLLVFPVVAYHFSITSGVFTESGAPGLVVAPGSYLAPSMFFALSGFLITSLLLAERERTERIDWKGFWSRRFRRLLPASLAVILGCAVIKNWQSIYLEHAGHGQQLRLLGPLSPYWSLAVEEQFYLGLSIVIALAARTRNSMGWLVGFLSAVWVLSAVALLTIHGSANRMFFGTDTRASEVVAGCLLAVVIHVYGWPRWRGWSTVGWIGLILTIIAWGTLGETEPWVIHGGLLLASGLNLSLIMGGIVEGSFARVMRFRPLVELGKLSYPVYLIHWPIALVLQPNRMGMTGWPLMIVRFVVSVAAGWALSQWVERPIRTKKVLPGREGVLLWAGVVAAALALCAWRGAV